MESTENDLSAEEQVSDRFRDGISVVVPVYNSQDSLQELCERLDRLFDKIALPYEIILVNDGSRDGSWQVIQELTQHNENILGLSLSRNYGQHNALVCGVRTARFPVCVTMDDDLQHPPEAIPLLLQGLTDDLDVVYGTPANLAHSPLRNAASLLGKLAVSSALGLNAARHISAFRVIRTELRNAFADFHSPNLQFDVLLSWGTNKFGAVEVQHDKRKFGRSNYSVLKLFNHALTLFTGYSTAPLRFATITGFSFSLFGFLVLIYVAVSFLLFGSIPGFPFLASVISIFGGVQLFALGILGEYIGRIFDCSMQQPLYLIRETTAGRSNVKDDSCEVSN
ncbi:Undecaprenyl-phosphate 4-deoxy-4-formamido-L-arabinose transferase [Bremerella volcania]|uniref:Undecaprenyl-phosphate 4-deoxy-4-formamido-L-arabinose transferase n=1 Tax=Bremerella volcania TaxID=2527984 RepID=A0A518C872_9BACT|nr:glycosyltransferase family 2 protein [Bremerella volcania]QDU75402.1 Undecaprenyl-phosphate 4-deoxy-4-formamido-L-arabinose transferase [Bremerella volcania]